MKGSRSSNVDRKGNFTRKNIALRPCHSSRLSPARTPHKSTSQLARFFNAMLSPKLANKTNSTCSRQMNKASNSGSAVRLKSHKFRIRTSCSKIRPARSILIYSLHARLLIPHLARRVTIKVSHRWWRPSLVPRIATQVTTIATGRKHCTLLMRHQMHKMNHKNPTLTTFCSQTRCLRLSQLNKIMALLSLNHQIDPARWRSACWASSALARLTDLVVLESLPEVASP